MGMGVLHTHQHVSSLRFIVQSGIRFLIRMGSGVLHTPQHVSGLMGIMIHTIQSFSGIGVNKYLFIRYLSRIGRDVLHTSLNVSGGSIIFPWTWVSVGRMQYAPTCTIQSLPEIRFNKYIFIRNLSGIDRCVLHNFWNVPNGSIIFPWT